MLEGDPFIVPSQKGCNTVQCGADGDLCRLKMPGEMFDVLRMDLKRIVVSMRPSVTFKGATMRCIIGRQKRAGVDKNVVYAFIGVRL